MQLVWQHYWFKKSDTEKELILEQDVSIKEQPNKKLYCHNCKHPVTDLDQAISINESHTHTFTNPAGYTYTVNCFQLAPGCIALGDSSSEYSWFSGYEWRIAICELCHEQLGWLFTNGTAFYALIEDRLIHTL